MSAPNWKNSSTFTLFTLLLSRYLGDGNAAVNIWKYNNHVHSYTQRVCSLCMLKKWRRRASTALPARVVPDSLSKNIYIYIYLFAIYLFSGFGNENRGPPLITNHYKTPCKNVTNIRKFSMLCIVLQMSCFCLNYQTWNHKESFKCQRFYTWWSERLSFCLNEVLTECINHIFV